MEKRSLDYLFNPDNRYDLDDEIHREEKKAFENERKAFSKLEFGERIENVRCLLNDFKSNLPDQPVIALDDFSDLLERKKKNHQNHVNIPVPWKDVKNRLVTNERSLRRGNQLISFQVEAFISQLPLFQPIFPTFNKKDSQLVKSRLFEIMNEVLNKSGISIKFFTVVKEDNVIIATVDLFDQLIWCSIVFGFEKNISEEAKSESSSRKEDVLIFSHEDLDNDMSYAIYLSLNVSFIDYFFHLCPCFEKRED